MRAGDDDSRSDADLLGKVAEGDQVAFGVLYDRHAPWLEVRLKAWLSRRSANLGIIDDVLQNTFFAVFQKPDAWRGDGEVAAWIWRIAMYKAIDELGARSKVREATLLVVDVMSEVRKHPLRHATASAEEELLRWDVGYGELGNALRKLSPELRDVLQTCCLDGLRTREAARLLRVPHGTIKTRLMRARNQLREELGRARTKLREELG